MCCRHAASSWAMRKMPLPERGRHRRRPNLSKKLATPFAVLTLLLQSIPTPSLAWTTPATSTATSLGASSRPNQPPPLLASNMRTPAVAEGEESLVRLTVPELKERLRSMGQKVTGNKSELIERLRTQQPSSIDDATNKEIVGIENIRELDSSLENLPDPLKQALIRYASSSAAPSSSEASPKLLPIQQQSYEVIAAGEDAVLFSPTGTGKTLAFVIPLAARLWGWKHDGSLKHQQQAQKRRFAQRQRRSGNDSLSSQPVDAATPSILVVEPSRELARQVGKVWGKFHPTAAKNSKRQVVTVYGGVPMARHAALLSSKTDVVVGTSGRIRELIREKYLSTAHVRSIVLDEADTLLDFKDNPEVDLLLDGMENDYQLVLASATVNKRVERFVEDVMELAVGERGYVVLDADGSASAINGENENLGGVEEDPSRETASAPKSSDNKPVVNHWSMAAGAASRIGLTSDLIITISPRRGIIFVPSKAEAEGVAQELMERLSTASDVSVHILHGDMMQAARSRTINAFSADTTKMARILVATDVASRGLDLPAVDLVLQYGVPRRNGKDGTCDFELYTHRTGRAGRFGSTRSADAILLYDRSQGEQTTLGKLQEEMNRHRNVDIIPRQLPSPSEVMKASYDRAAFRCEEFGRHVHSDVDSQSLIKYFSDRLSDDLSCHAGASEKETILMKRLATAMAALSGLDGSVPPRSLLTADHRDRTIRVWNNSSNSSNPLSPPEVTKVLKALGSGKLGRISITRDGSAVLDLASKKAERLLKHAAADDDLLASGWHFEMPASLR